MTKIGIREAGPAGETDRSTFRLRCEEVEARNAPGSLLGALTDPLADDWSGLPVPTSNLISPTAIGLQPALTATEGDAVEPAPVASAVNLAPSRAVGTPAFSGTADEGDGDHVYETHTWKHVYLGGGYSPGDVDGVYSDHAIPWLPPMIASSIDVIGEGAGLHLHTIAPDIGSAFPGSGGAYHDQPISVTYGVGPGEEFATINAGTDGWSIAHTTSRTVSGLYDAIYDPFLHNTYVVPTPDGNTVTVTARTQDTIVHTTDGVVTSLELAAPVTRSHTLPVESYDGGKTIFNSSEYSGPVVSSWYDPPYGGTGGGGAAVGQSIAGFQEAQAAPPGGSAQTANTSSAPGVLWREMSYVRSVATAYAGRPGVTILWDEYSVPLRTGGPRMTVLEAKPMNLQPVVTQAAVAAEGSVISYNCHGYSFGAVGVQDAAGQSHTFWINPAEAKKMITVGPGSTGNTPVYRERVTTYTPPETILLGSSDIVAILDQAGDPIHTMILGTPNFHDTPDGKKQLSLGSPVTTKDGVRPLANADISFEWRMFESLAANNVPGATKPVAIKVYGPVYVYLP